MSISKNTVNRSNGCNIVSRKGGAHIQIVEKGETPDWPIDADSAKSTQKYRDGHSDGWQACQEQYKKEIETLQTQLKSATDTLPQSLNNAITELEKQLSEEICELSVQIADIILRDTEISTHAVKSAIREGLSQPFFQEGDIVIEMCQYDADNIESLDISRFLPDQFRIKHNNNLNPGDVRMYCNDHLLDATLDRRLKNLRRHIHNALINNGDNPNNAEPENPTVKETQDKPDT